MPGIEAGAVKKARTVDAPDSAQESQRRGALLFAGKDRLGIEQDIELGAVNLRHDITMIVFGDLVLLAILTRFFDLTLAAARTTTAATFAMLVAVHAQEQQTVNPAAFQRLVGLEGLNQLGLIEPPVFRLHALGHVAKSVVTDGVPQVT